MVGFSRFSRSRKEGFLAAEFFGTRRYQNTATRNGYMTWSAWDAQGREWKFQKDHTQNRTKGASGWGLEIIHPHQLHPAARRVSQAAAA